GAAGICADAAVAEAGRDRGCGAATGAAGNAREVPGIAGGTVVRVVGGYAVGEFVEIGFAEEDGAGFFELGPDYGVMQRDKIFQNFGAGGGADVLRVDVVFEGDGNAVERAAVAMAFAAAGSEEFGFGFFGLGQGLLGGDGDVGV